MACWEGKKYKLDKSENFDEYMKELGEWPHIFKNVITQDRSFFFQNFNKIWIFIHAIPRGTASLHKKNKKRNSRPAVI